MARMITVTVCTGPYPGSLQKPKPTLFDNFFEDETNVIQWGSGLCRDDYITGVIIKFLRVVIEVSQLLKIFNSTLLDYSVQSVSCYSREGRYFLIHSTACLRFDGK
jgi:hypothetical protein